MRFALKVKYAIAKKMADQMFEKFKKDDSGESPIKALVMIVVIAILAGALLGTGIDALYTGKNASGSWTAAETSTYAVISILILVAVIMLVIRVATE